MRPIPTVETRASIDSQDIATTYRKISESLVSWLERKLGDRATAEDIAQNVFLTVWSRSHQVTINHPAALMFKVARDLTINEYKRRERRDAPAVSADDDDCPQEASALATDLDPEITLAHKEALALTMAEIDGLPKETQIIFKLNRFEEQSYADIALQLNVSVSTVEKNMMKALSALRASRN